MNRRHFSILSAGSALSMTGWARAVPRGEGYFSLRSGRGVPSLVDPDGARFFSLGINLPTRPARPSEREVREWQRHYGRDAQAWLASSRIHVFAPGMFNVSGRGEVDSVTPYCHLVPFSGARRWDERESQCNYLLADWEEWCDHVAREHCQARAQDRNLVGYFYSNSPRWIHGAVQGEWRGPISDPDLARTEAGRRELRSMARRYYEVTRAAIRRYDPHHLILGDRYPSSAALPPEVYEEAVPRVDVLSFQGPPHSFRTLQGLFERTGKPILLADCETGDGIGPERSLRWYRTLLEEAAALRGCVGIHISGGWRECALAGEQAESSAALRRLHARLGRQLARRV